MRAAAVGVAAALAFTAGLVGVAAQPAAAIENGIDVDNPPGWVAGLVTADTGKTSCGGTLITPTAVLTAAHCVDGSVLSHLTLGSPYPGTVPASADGPPYYDDGINVDIAVDEFGNQRIVVHPCYRNNGGYIGGAPGWSYCDIDGNPTGEDGTGVANAVFDVAVIHLAEAAPLAYLPLPIAPASAELAHGDPITLFGYGLTSQNGEQASQLQRTPAGSTWIDTGYCFAGVTCVHSDAGDDLLPIVTRLWSGDSGSGFVAERVPPASPLLVSLLSGERNSDPVFAESPADAVGAAITRSLLNDWVRAAAQIPTYTPGTRLTSGGGAIIIGGDGFASHLEPNACTPYSTGITPAEYAMIPKNHIVIGNGCADYPEALDDIVNAETGTPFFVDPFSNDSEPDGVELTIVDDPIGVEVDDIGYGPGLVGTGPPQPGTYTITYQWCVEPGDCHQADVTVLVEPGPLFARNDTATSHQYDTARVDVLDNDNYDDPETVTIELLTDGYDWAIENDHLRPRPRLLIDTNDAGTIDVDYRICEGTRCSTATITIDVEPFQPSFVAAPDTADIEQGQQTLVDVLANDLVFEPFLSVVDSGGLDVDVVDNPDPAPGPWLPSSHVIAVTASTDTTPGVYVITYQACNAFGPPGDCAQSTLTVTVTETDDQDPTPPDCNGQTPTIVGTSGDDTLVGTDGDDVIAGLGGNDSIDGLRGDDLICGGAGDDTIDAGRGDDTVVDLDGHNTVHGSFGDDTITLGDGDDWVNAGPQHDTVDAGNGTNTVFGDKGHDTIVTGDGDDWIDGNQYDDIIDAGNGNNYVDGGAGNDTITTGDGDDIVDAAWDDDWVDTGAGIDQIDGGPDTDICINGETVTDCENPADTIQLTVNVFEYGTDDEPVDSAAVTLFDLDQNEIATVTSDASGVAEFDIALDPSIDTVVLRIIADGYDVYWNGGHYGDNRDSFEGAVPFTLNEFEPGEINRYLIPADNPATVLIPGTIMDTNGDPLDANVTVTDLEGNTIITLASEGGDFIAAVDLADAEAGLLFRFDADGYITEWWDNRTSIETAIPIVTSTDTSELDVTLEAEPVGAPTVTVNAVDGPSDGTIAIASATVTIVDTDGALISIEETDETGQVAFELDPELDGTVATFTVEADGYQQQWYGNAATFEDAEYFTLTAGEPAQFNVYLLPQGPDQSGPGPFAARNVTVPDGSAWDVIFGAETLCGSTTAGNVYCIDDTGPGGNDLKTPVVTEYTGTGDGTGFDGSIVAGDSDCIATASSVYCMWGSGEQGRFFVELDEGTLAGETIVELAHREYGNRNTVLGPCVIDADRDAHCYTDIDPGEPETMSFGNVIVTGGETTPPSYDFDTIYVDTERACGGLGGEMWCWGPWLFGARAHGPANWGLDCGGDGCADPGPAEDPGPITDLSIHHLGEPDCALYGVDIWCGDSEENREIFSDREVFEGEDVLALDGSYYRTCAVTSTGRVICWGYPYYYALGQDRYLPNGERAPQNWDKQPVEVPGVTVDTTVPYQIDGGWGHVAVEQGGNVTMWGSRGGYVA